MIRRKFYLMQQRLALTRTETNTLSVLTLVFAVGLAGSAASRYVPPAELDQAVAMDSLFLALAAGPLDADHDAAVDDEGAEPESGNNAPVRTRSPATPASLRPIDINTASAAALQQLPRIGPAMAARIVEHRETFGPFRRVEDLGAVRGIGPATLERLRPLVVVRPAPGAEAEPAETISIPQRTPDGDHPD
jgi:competence ComEA-like helix-hairpin-helix protein